MTPEDADARAAELLAANGREVERRRAAEAEVAALRARLVAVEAWPFDRAPVRRSYLRGLGIALDRFGNAILGGDCDLTISQQAACGARFGTPRACVLCGFLGVFAKRHCEEALRGAVLPPP